MVRRTSFSTGDPEEAKQFFADTYTGARWRGAVDRKAFELTDRRIEAGEFSLSEMRMESRVVSTFCPEDVYFVTYLRAGTLAIDSGGLETRVAPGDLVLGGQPGIEATSDAAFIDQEVATVSREAVREAADLAPDAEAPSFASILPRSARQTPAWRATQLYLQAVLGGETTDSPLLLGSARRLLASLLLDTFRGPTEPTSRGATARGPATLRRAVSFIESNADQDIGIADIAAAARVSQRSVEYHFRHELDTTPTAYLRQIRLDLAHRELQAADPEDGLTVTAVAYRWGFSSLSRFGAYYRATYGVPPSVTLGR
jgi:AraC-like DNA-binding protein